ncbi:transketolase [Peptoniphilus equinus]|uniref:Transketolase n=1 Tax=Peptoniphilus equinus TaxID=3016343 RepID=A0ABY7QUJ7_9FIRM|nr:transketolase [Peptoniphilus equinus]WBW50464.1 transketolase [Peptoniphilus equinus]
MNIETKAINTIRLLSVDQVQKANSGHPGLPLGAAPMAYTVFNKMKVNPKDPEWFNRDRFILSAGHGSSMLYSLLHLYGYGLQLDDLKNFRQLGSLTPGHPEYGHTKGVDATTGPLGQGISMAVGMAMAERHLAALYNNELELINHYTYVICGDGDLMEGISNEASSLAGTMKLGKLIVLYDSNSISIEGSTDLAFTEDVKARYAALGWDVQGVSDGNDIDAISEAIDRAKDTDKPSLIAVTTQIGYGSPRAGTAKAHGEPLGEEGVLATKQAFGAGEGSFIVDDDVKAHFEAIVARKQAAYDADKHTEERYRTKYADNYEKLQRALSGDFELDLFKDENYYKFDKDMASRAASGQIMNSIADNFESFFGGSADLAPSNKTHLDKYANFSASTPEGANINFGVREHAMGAIVNGIMLHGGLQSFGATFLVFADYMKPAIRLAAIQSLGSIFVFTHDSIGVGEDGPTHQPIEQLAMLRAIPNHIVFRPADATETAVAWNVALTSKNTPVSLILSRQTLKNIDGSSRDAQKGAYIVKEPKQVEKIIIATGSEVSLALEAADDTTRVVSMPSRALFEAQVEAYRESILPKAVKKRVVVEAASSFGWHKYAGDEGKLVTLDEFGASAPAGDVYKFFNITTEAIKVALNELK